LFAGFVNVNAVMTIQQLALDATILLGVVVKEEMVQQVFQIVIAGL